MSTYSITVLITTYNYGQFVEQAIDSVLSQDFPQDLVEIIVVDDGSTDDTAERVKRYGSQVRYFRKENGGQASALNLGLLNARGEIISLLDADDLFLPGKLARIAKSFESDLALGMVYHPQLEWNAATNERRSLSLQLFSGDLRTDPKQILGYHIQPASCVSFRRSKLDSLLPIPESIRMLADAYLVILVPMISPVLALPEALTLYRIHGSNSYYANEQNMPQDVRSKRSVLIQTLVQGMLQWVAANREFESERHIKFFKNRWVLQTKALEYEKEPPGRWRSFLFLFRQNYVFSPLQSWKFTLFKYLSAFSALLLGYTRTQRWGDDLLKSFQRWLKSPTREPGPAR